MPFQIFLGKFMPTISGQHASFSAIYHVDYLPFSIHDNSTTIQQLMMIRPQTKDVRFYVWSVVRPT